MLKFCKIPDTNAAARVIALRLSQELEAGRNVLWLLSGNTNLAIEVAAMKLLAPELQPQLTIMFSDERYGPIGHKDSNLQQLYDAGFAAGQATVVPTLTSNELSLEATSEHYLNAIKRAFVGADAIITELGVGPDGHVAGILPDSPSVTAESLVACYRTEQYERITLSFAALKRSTAAYVFAFGAGKLEQLEKLRDHDLPLNQQPAQILKQIPEAYVYNDQIGG